MTNLETETFLRETMADLWPDFSPGEHGKIKMLWYKVLRPLDKELAEQAADELKLCKFVGKVPDPGKFREIANKLKNEGRGSIVNQTNLPEPTVFVMCTASGSFLAGTFWPVYIQPVNQQHSEQYLVDCAHRWIDGIAGDDTKPGLKAFYGGQWEVFQGHTYPQMKDLRMQYQPKDIPIKAKGNLGEAIGEVIKTEIDEFDLAMKG